MYRTFHPCLYPPGRRVVAQVDLALLAVGEDPSLVPQIVTRVVILRTDSSDQLTDTCAVVPFGKNKVL